MTNTTLVAGDRVQLADLDACAEYTFWHMLARFTGSRWATVKRIESARCLVVRVDYDQCDRVAKTSEVVAVVRYGSAGRE